MPSVSSACLFSLLGVGVRARVLLRGGGWVGGILVVSCGSTRMPRAQCNIVAAAARCAWNCTRAHRRLVSKNTKYSLVLAYKDGRGTRAVPFVGEQGRNEIQFDMIWAMYFKKGLNFMVNVKGLDISQETRAPLRSGSCVLLAFCEAVDIVRGTCDGSRASFSRALSFSLHPSLPTYLSLSLSLSLCVCVCVAHTNTHTHTLSLSLSLSFSLFLSFSLLSLSVYRGIYVMFFGGGGGLSSPCLPRPYPDHVIPN